MADDKPWRDEELMRELYHGKRMSQQDIADYFDNEITQAGVGYCLDELGIEKRSRSESAKVRCLKTPLKMRTHIPYGYEYVSDRSNDDRDRVYLHRLLAVHKYGMDAVAGMDVHHEINIPWLNTPDNISLKTRSEHAAHHAKDRLR